jgi:branched-chain amino acid transport system permease protein
VSRERAYQIGWGVVATVFLLLLPKFFPLMLVHRAIEILYSALFATSFNLLFGYTGMLPFGHAAFFGLGAYITALIFNHLPQFPLLLTVLVAALSGLVAGVLIGFICVRLSGPYFSLGSFAFQMFLYAVALKWRAVTGGDDGMSIIRPELHLPVLGSLSLGNIHNLYYLTLVIVALGIFACYLFLKTPLGNSVLCMRENDIRASFLGYNVFLTKLTIFSFSGFLAGLAGSLFALFQGFVATSCIDMNMSFQVVLMVVIGGTDYFLGPVLGAAFYLVFQDWLSSLTKHWWIFMGILFVLVVIYAEGGLISLFKAERVRLWVNRLRNKR